MAEPFIKPSFSAGELAPALYGRVDLTKWHAGCSVARNCFVSYKGGMSSRAGTAFVGQCKQAASASSVDPRIIKFKFSITQSYILELGDLYMRVVADGGYVTEAPVAVTAASQANPGVLRAPGNAFVNGDWIFLANLGGMIPLDGETYIVANANPGAGTFTLTDLFGVPVNTLGFPAYTVGGTAARIYTLATPYLAVDLPYLKFTQSADVMSICVVNQQTLVDYPPADLTRLAANNWTLTPTTFASAATAPVVTGVVASNTTMTNPVAYAYVVTTVDDATGQESVASNVGSVTGSVDISQTFGTLTVSWTAVANARAYNIYKATPSFTNVVPTGVLFGYAGTVTGAATSWQDDNVLQDFTVVPPLHLNPFPSPHNYPATVSYFQQRRVYGYTINAPDTYEMSQPGAYKNFDAADPPIASDAITGNPWALQVNGIQAMLPMPGGLIVATGEDAWQVSGTGGAGSAITPGQQSAQQQESNGFSPTVMPIKINSDILYVSSFGYGVYAMKYDFYINMYGGLDISVLSSHLFDGFQIVQWAWAKQPFKVMWCARNDGKMLALTWLREQELCGWTRSDTCGLAVSVASASEPPVDATYWIVKRYIAGKQAWAYYTERMDNRLWPNVEQVWAVDAGLALPQPAPNAALAASTATLLGGISGGIPNAGGAGYTAPHGDIIDPTGQGTGATVAFTLNAGAIATMTCPTEGSGYQPGSYVLVSDPTGSGAVIELLYDNPVTFQASAPVFVPANIGSIIRLGGGRAQITATPSPTTALAQLLAPITATIPNDPSNMPLPAPAGTWTMTAPVSTVTGLNHLEGMTVYGLADGSVFDPVVVANGAIALPAPASQVTVGLPFVAQTQSLHAALPAGEIQGKHKKIIAVTLRIANSRGIRVGQDQPIAAATANQAETAWGQTPYGALTETEDRRFGLTGANAVDAGAAIPLFTGDIRVPITTSDWNTPDGQRSPGMVGVQQSYPLPMDILAFIPEIVVGDTNG